MLCHGRGKKNPRSHEESNPSPSAPALDVLPLSYKELYGQLGYNSIDVYGQLGYDNIDVYGQLGYNDIDV